MAFCEILHHVGDRGKFQILRIVFYIILSLLLYCHDVIENFTAAIPDHYCSVNLLENPGSKINITMNLTTEALLKVSIPMGPNQKLEQCRRFRHTQWQILDSNVSISNNTDLETEPCLDGWTYDHSVFASTIVTEWDLVCNFQSFKYYAQTIAMAGYFVAGFAGSIFSDRFGRKPVLVFSCVSCGIWGTCCAFAPSFFLYCVLRFLVSVSINNIIINSPILVFEETSPQWHSLIILLSGLSSSIGLAGFGGLAYVLSDWHMLQLAVSLPYFIFSIVFCWGPESVQWLINTGKTEQAVKELQRIAFINGKKDIACNLTTENYSVVYNSWSWWSPMENMSACLLILFLSVLIFAAILFKYHGFAEIFSLLGILLDIQILGKNIFLSQILLGVVDIPSKLLAYFIIRNVRRRSSFAFSVLTVGTCIIINIFLPKEMYVLRLIIFLICKGSFSVFICIHMFYNQETTPTILRSTVNGVYNLVARIAGIMSALVLITRKHFEHLPMILFGVIPIVASINIYFLPETFNLPHFDTIKDLEKRFMNKSANEKEEQDFLETTGC